MSEEINQEIAEQSNESQNDETEIDYKSLYEETKKALDKVAAHKDKLYQETKVAKAEREAAKLEAQRIEQEKAMKDGEYEKLWQNTKQEKEALINQLNEIKTANRNEKIQIASLKIANELADGDNVELLSEFVNKKMLALADEYGKVEPEVVNAVLQEFKSNSKFKSLLRGSKAVGGGAPGGRGTSESKTISRSDFDAMTHGARAQYLKSGGRLSDN